MRIIAMAGIDRHGHRRGRRAGYTWLFLAGLAINLLFSPGAFASGPQNLNVLFVGVDGPELLMTAVYTVDCQRAMQSGAVFLPRETLVLSHGRPATLASLYAREDVAGMVPVLEQALGADIAYYIRIERRVLREVAGFLGPIVVNGKEVPLDDLFTMAITPADDVILGQLLQKLTRPSVYFFHLPRLVLASNRYVQTDFKPTLENLWLHFRLITSIDPARVRKTVLQGRPVQSPEGPAIIVPESAWRAALDDVSR